MIEEYDPDDVNDSGATTTITNSCDSGSITFTSPPSLSTFPPLPSDLPSLPYVSTDEDTAGPGTCGLIMQQKENSQSNHTSTSLLNISSKEFNKNRKFNCLTTIAATNVTATSSNDKSICVQIEPDQVSSH